MLHYAYLGWWCGIGRTPARRASQFTRLNGKLRREDSQDVASEK